MKLVAVQDIWEVTLPLVERKARIIINVNRSYSAFKLMNMGCTFLSVRYGYLSVIDMWLIMSLWMFHFNLLGCQQFNYQFCRSIWLIDTNVYSIKELYISEYVTEATSESDKQDLKTWICLRNDLCRISGGCLLQPSLQHCYSVCLTLLGWASYCVLNMMSALIPWGFVIVQFIIKYYCFWGIFLRAWTPCMITCFRRKIEIYQRLTMEIKLSVICYDDRIEFQEWGLKN